MINARWVVWWSLLLLYTTRVDAKIHTSDAQNLSVNTVLAGVLQMRVAELTASVAVTVSQ